MIYKTHPTLYHPPTTTLYTRSRITRTRLYQIIAYFEATFRTKNHSINSMLKSSVILNWNNEIPAYFKPKWPKFDLQPFNPLKFNTFPFLSSLAHDQLSALQTSLSKC